MKALIAATLFALSFGSAHAGNIQNWDAITISADDFACMDDFDNSQVAYRECRAPAVNKLYDAHSAMVGCDRYDLWQQVRKAEALLRKEGYNRQPGITYSKEWEKSQFLIVKYGTTQLLTVQEKEEMPKICVRSTWVSQQLDKEVSFLNKKLR